MSDREKTQEFTVMNILVRYCNKTLSPQLIEQIVDELLREMKNSPTSWAFK